MPARVSIAVHAEWRCRAHQSATACLQPAKRRRVGRLRRLRFGDTMAEKVLGALAWR